MPIEFANVLKFRIFNSQDYLKTVVPSQLFAERGSNLVVINPGSFHLPNLLKHTKVQFPFSFFAIKFSFFCGHEKVCTLCCFAPDMLRNLFISGSASIKIGLAQQDVPLNVPHCIAWRTTGSKQFPRKNVVDQVSLFFFAFLFSFSGLGGGVEFVENQKSLIHCSDCVFFMWF